MQFPGTLALDDVDFDVVAGEVHVLFGENGAGKSTLIQLLAGVHQATAGEVFLQGKAININSVREARELGISAVFQEFSLVPQLTIAENLVLGAESVTGPFLQKKKLEKRAQEILGRLGFPLKPNSLVMYLSRAEQQMVEIAKAFRTTPKLIIFDEPTASLTDRETEQLFNLIHQPVAQRLDLGRIFPRRLHHPDSLQTIGPILLRPETFHARHAHQQQIEVPSFASIHTPTIPTPTMGIGDSFPATDCLKATPNMRCESRTSDSIRRYLGLKICSGSNASGKRVAFGRIFR